MIQGQQLDRNAFTLDLDSSAQGWRALLLRQVTSVASCEETFIPAIPEHTITMLLSGESDVASDIDGQWRWARTSPGTISMTAPGRPTRLRWRARSSEPLRSVALSIPISQTNRLVEELWDQDPARIVFPDTLSVTDPVLDQTVRGLLRAAGDGLPDTYAEAAIDFLIVHTLLRHGDAPPIRGVGAEDRRIRQASS